MCLFFIITAQVDVKYNIRHATTQRVTQTCSFQLLPSCTNSEARKTDSISTIRIVAFFGPCISLIFIRLRIIAKLEGYGTTIVKATMIMHFISFSLTPLIRIKLVLISKIGVPWVPRRWEPSLGDIVAVDLGILDFAVATGAISWHHHSVAAVIQVVGEMG